MNIFADISKEELSIFLEEADEQLQLLDETFITLEKEQGSPEVLQEIFRAAHTLKGSSAMIGYEPMSRVAHVMETILDKVRNRTLQIDANVINSLLFGLDALKALRNGLTSEEEANIDISSVLRELEKISGSGGAPCNCEKTKKAVPAKNKTSDKISDVAANEKSTFRISIALDPNCSWAAVRCFQATKQLAGFGQIIECTPSHEEIESGQCGNSLVLVLTSNKQADVIKSALAEIPDIVEIKVDSCGQMETNGPKVLSTTEASGENEANINNPAGGTNQKAQTSQSIRVDVKLLDNLMNLVGEMVIDRNRLGQTSRALHLKYKGDETVASLEEIFTHLTRTVSELHGNILKARMVPIGTICNGLPRMVRDLAQKAGKQIDFVIEGRETELDRGIIEQIRDPLIHLLRNAVDHGIETPNERKRSGKVEQGQIRLLAYQEQNHIIIIVEDDGRGINAGAIREVAVKKGLINSKEATGLNDIEAMDLAFTSGISTAKEVTEVSGRGVGLDVVRTNVESIGGSVDLETIFGKGTKFTIRLPLTLMTINGFLVSSNEMTYVIPMTSMVEVLKLDPRDIETVMGKQVVKVRDKVFPLLKLDRDFIRETVQIDQSDGALVTIIKAGEKNIALAVDSVREPQEVVVKSMGKYIGGVRGVTGATILGDGRVALIIDAPTMAREAIGC